MKAPTDQGGRSDGIQPVREQFEPLVAVVLFGHAVPNSPRDNQIDESWLLHP
jgi:hypothetical protein